MTASNSPRFSRIFAMLLSGATLFAGSSLGFAAPRGSLAQQASHATRASIMLVSGSQQRTTYAAAFAKPLQVQVTDAATHKALAGVLVDFAPAAGLALSSTSSVTDEFGLASVSATGKAIGTSSVEAFVESSPATKVRFEALEVGKAVITIVPSNLTAAVGTVPALTEYQLQGFRNGETVESAHVTGKPVLTTVATTNSGDANYAIKGWPGTLSSPNYTFAPGFGTLVLTGSQAATAALDANTETLIAAADPATIRPALNWYLLPSSQEKNTSDSVSQVRSTAVTSALAQQDNTTAITGSIHPAVPSYNNSVTTRNANSSEIRPTVLSSTASTGNQVTSVSVVRSAILQRSQPRLDATLQSSKLRVAAAGIKAPGF